MSKMTLIIAGSPVTGLPLEEQILMVANAMRRGLAVSYLPVELSTEVPSIHGFIIDSKFYEWRLINDLPKGFRAFWVWDIISGTLHNPEKACYEIQNRRGKDYMRVGNKWLRANICQSHTELTKYSSMEEL